MKTQKSDRFVWRKLSPSKWDDVWQERLGWLKERLVIINFSGKPTSRLEAYHLKKSEADELVKEFGGQLRKDKPMTAKELEPQPRPPIQIRGKILIVSSLKEQKKALKEYPHIISLLIPASFAFGTGEHITTANCLRMIADVTGNLTAGKWEALDLGTGSGILAMASRVLGAKKVEAADHDESAIRAAKENAATNRITGITLKRLDVLKWKPTRQWALVTANLFSPILIAAAKQITAAVAPGGSLIMSGILAIQADEVVAAFKKQGIRFEKIIRKGKWVTCLGSVN